MVALSAVSTQFSLSDDELRQLLPALAEPVWDALRKLRNWVHHGRCATSAQGIVNFILTGADVGRCNPDCVDLFTTTFAHVAHKVAAAGGQLRSPDAFAATIARRFAAELLRKENVAAGGMAKPERTDGVPGIVTAALPADVRPELLGWMLRDATRRAPVPSEGWSYEEFAARLLSLRPDLDPVEAMAMVRRGVEAIRRTAMQVAPTGWVAHYLDEPRDLRRERYQPVPIVASWVGEDELGIEVIAAAMFAEDPAAGARAQLRTVFRRELARRSPVDAVRIAIATTAPAISPAALSEREMELLAVEYVVEIALQATPVEEGVRRLPTAAELRHIVAAACGAPTLLAHVDEAFFRQVFSTLPSLAGVAGAPVRQS